MCTYVCIRGFVKTRVPVLCVCVCGAIGGYRFNLKHHQFSANFVKVENIAAHIFSVKCNFACIDWLTTMMGALSAYIIMYAADAVFLIQLGYCIIIVIQCLHPTALFISILSVHIWERGRYYEDMHITLHHKAPFLIKYICRQWSVIDWFIAVKYLIWLDVFGIWHKIVDTRYVAVYRLIRLPQIQFYTYLCPFVCMCTRAIIEFTKSESTKK